MGGTQSQPYAISVSPPKLRILYALTSKARHDLPDVHNHDIKKIDVDPNSGLIAKVQFTHKEGNYVNIQLNNIDYDKNSITYTIPEGTILFNKFTKITTTLNFNVSPEALELRSDYYPKDNYKITPDDITHANDLANKFYQAVQECIPDA